MGNGDLAIIGITRFSLVLEKHQGSFTATRGISYDEAASRIFDSKRMAHRFRLFRVFCLPTIMSLVRRDSRVHHIILVSKEMPLRWQVRLRAMVFGHPRVHVVSLSRAERFGPAVCAFAERIVSGDVFTFRLDDDDALSRDYLPTVLEWCTSHPIGICLSLDDGLRVAIKDGILLWRKTTMPCNAQGLGYLAAGTKLKTILDLGDHTKIADHTPTHHIKGIQWLYSIHGMNDGGLRISPNLRDEHARTIIETRFPHVDLRRAVSVLRREAS